MVQYLNNLRALACILVILTHSAMSALNPSMGIYMVIFSLIASPSSELFVTISSSLLAPTKQQMFPFYKKRFAKLLGPFLFWSIIFVILKYSQGNLDISEMAESLLLFPIRPVTGVYWFVYTICGLYLLTPIVSPWLEKATKKEHQFVLLLWFITLLLPYLNIFFDQNIYKYTGDYYFILTYFGGFAGYMFMGVYLRKYPLLISNKVKALVFITLLLIVGTLPIVYGYLFNRESLEMLKDNLSMTSALYVMGIFCFFQNFKIPHILEYIFNKVAKYSFGIYLIHIIVVRDIVWKLLEHHRLPHPIIETPFIAITSLLICLVIVKLISFLPKSKYIIGA